MRRVYTRTPGSRTVVHYTRRKPKAPHCAQCGDVLKGTTRLRPSMQGKAAKSSRRPERPYGGMLCAACMRRTIVEQVRKQP